MKKRQPRSPDPSIPVNSAKDSPLRLPVELHSAWLHYLSQPELLHVGAVSRSWRALVLREPHFYLAVFLQIIRGRRQKTFVQHLDYATRRKLPIGVILDFPYTPNKASCDILANKVFPAIKRAMPYVRKLSIVCASPLPASSLAFLQARAPSLREFVYKLDPEYDPDEEDWGSEGGSDYGNYDDYDSDGWEPAAASPPHLPARLFGRTAPRLATLELFGIPLPESPVAAFARVSRVDIADLEPVPRIGVGAHFPAAKHLAFALECASFKAGDPDARSTWLPAGLASLDVRVGSRDLRSLCRVARLATVPQLTVAFDWQYECEPEGSPGFPAPGASDRTFWVQDRDAAWAACLAHLAPPHRMVISCTSYDSEDQPADVRVAIADGTRSVTFYTEDAFVDMLDGGVQYDPLESLRCLASDLAEIHVCHAHLHAVFYIDNQLPALLELRVSLGDTGRTRAPFKLWDEEKDPVGMGIECPALERLVLCCDAPIRNVEIASHDLAQFARALGLRVSAAARPRLVLRGVCVLQGMEHEAFFAL